jgi:hypothetical protein
VLRIRITRVGYKEIAEDPGTFRNLSFNSTAVFKVVNIYLPLDNGHTVSGFPDLYKIARLTFWQKTDPGNYGRTLLESLPSILRDYFLSFSDKKKHGDVLPDTSAQ